MTGFGEDGLATYADGTKELKVAHIAAHANADGDNFVEMFGM